MNERALERKIKGHSAQKKQMPQTKRTDVAKKPAVR